VTAGSPLHTPHCGAASHPSSSKCSSPGRRTDRLRTTGRRLRSAAVQGTIRSDPRLAPPARGRARLPHSSARRRPVRSLGLDPGRSGRRRARPLTARSRSSRHAARARPTRYRAHGARIDPGGAAPRVPAMRRGRGVCDRARPRSPCTSGTGAPAIRARCGAPTASRCSTTPRHSASRVRGRPTCRAPLIEPQSAIAHRDPSPEQNTLADDVTLLCSAGHRQAQRCADDQPGQTKVSPGNAPGASLAFRPHSVHEFHLGRIPAVAAVHSDF
jgi:hypothetical protein